MPKATETENLSLVVIFHRKRNEGWRTLEQQWSEADTLVKDAAIFYGRNQTTNNTVNHNTENKI